MQKKYSLKDGEKVWNAFKQMKLYLEKSYQVLSEVNSEGFYLTQKNKRVYDGVSTLLNTNAGHNNRAIIDAINNQLGILDNVTLFTATSDVAIECSKMLCGLTEHHFYSCFFTNSGSEACDTAIKIVRKYTYNKKEGRLGIVSLKGAYHGSSVGAMMLSKSSYDLEKYYLNSDGFYQITPPGFDDKPDGLTQKEWIECCVKEFEDLVNNDDLKIGAVFMELIQLSNAVNILPKEYVQGIFKVCKEKHILLVIDEIATGFGRTGKMFASEHYGIWADIMLTAKGITSGYIPMGSVMVTEEVFKNFWGEDEELELEHGFTTSGHPVACAAAIENLNQIIQCHMVENSEKMGGYLLNLLKDAIGTSGLVKEIRGKGLMISIVFNVIKIKGMEDWGIADIVSRFLVNKGLLIYPDSAEVLIVAPALNVTGEKCEMIASIIKYGIQNVEFLLK